MDAIIRDSFPYANRLFGEDVDVAWGCVNADAFPDWEKKIQDLALAQLLYLASCADHPEKSYFTSKHVTILTKADKWDKTANRSLWIGLALCAVAVLAGTYLALVPTGNGTPGSSPTPAFIGETTGVALIGLAGMGISFFATGFSPHYASTADNDRQNTLNKIEGIFKELTVRIIELYFSEGKNEAIIIAKQIQKLEAIDSVFNQYFADPERTEMIIGQFKQIIHFVSTDGVVLPKAPTLRHLINTERR
jgi:hypothetical protein